MIRVSFRDPLKWFLFTAIAVTGVCAALYASIQQNYRQNLNDPQIAIAEDIAHAAATGALPAEIVPHGAPIIDIGESLSPWITLYDEGGRGLESTGALNRAPLELPAGVFDVSSWTSSKRYTLSVGEETRFTWQASEDVRQAVVLVKLSETKNSVAYVAVGRNMREVEERIAQAGFLIFLAWTFTLGCLLVASFIFSRLFR